MNWKLPLAIVSLGFCVVMQSLTLEHMTDRLNKDEKMLQELKMVVHIQADTQSIDTENLLLIAVEEKRLLAYTAKRDHTTADAIQRKSVIVAPSLSTPSF